MLRRLTQALHNYGQPEYVKEVNSAMRGFKYEAPSGIATEDFKRLHEKFGVGLIEDGDNLKIILAKFPADAQRECLELAFGSLSKCMPQCLSLGIYGATIPLLPEGIGALKNLKSLTFSFDTIKELPKGIGSLVNLETLEIQRSTIENENGFEGLDGLTNLVNLVLRYDGLKHIPDCVSRLKGLESLDLLGNPISSEEYNKLSGLSKLVELRLGRTDAYDIPPVVFSMGRLSKLYLGKSDDALALMLRRRDTHD